ncbi:MAG: hypothetical protein ABJE95_23450 [Byssovorax sp.]
MNKLLLSLAALSLLTACEAGAPPAGGATPADAANADKTGHFVVRAPGGSVVEVLIDNDNITGPDVSVTRYKTASEHAIRGTAFGSPVDVAVADKKATGILGTGPLDISTEHREGKVHVTGLVGGATSDFEVNMKVLKGKIGACLYDLSWTGKSYEGTRGCGSSAEPVSVSVPTTLGKWSDPELGVCLGLLMGQASAPGMSGVTMRSTNPHQPLDQAGAHPTSGGPRGGGGN